MTTHLLETHPNVGLYVLNQVTEVDVSIRIG
jgi:hypothetical protein